MELAPVPHRPSLSGRGRVLLGAAAFLPVVLLVLVPAMLGMERSVVTDTAMSGAIDRGSLVFERDVPVSDLRVGDVIRFQPEHPAAGRGAAVVTSRVISVEQGRVRTQGDAHDVPDPGALVLDGPTQARVAFAVPWVGLPFLAVPEPAAWVAWAVLLGVVLGAAPLLGRGARRRASASPAPVLVARRPARSRLVR